MGRESEAPNISCTDLFPLQIISHILFFSLISLMNLVRRFFLKTVYDCFHNLCKRNKTHTHGLIWHQFLAVGC